MTNQMYDHSRLSTPSLSSSGGRLPPIARPDWPWAARSYSQRSQQPSPHPGLQGSGLPSSWDSRSSVSSSNSQTGYTGLHQPRNTSTPKPLWNSMNFLSCESTRQWTFTGFEWAIRDVHKLRDFVEGINNVGESHGDFEVLQQSPMLGDGKFKLEIAPTLSTDGTTSNMTTLSLYITSLMVDTQDEYEAYASLVAAVKCQDDLAGQRGARPEWVWEFWQNDWVFRRGSEVWECPLPSLTSLLENPRIRDTDSLVICIQIHCPVGPSIPQQPSVYYVPKDLLDGLEASLDNPNTGDVRFICLERYTNQEEDSNSNPHIHPSMSSSPSGTSSPFFGYATARKRIIYAHSDILIRRSEYFATMLTSSFAENSAPVKGERKVYTVIVEEADFETIYWLLKYCYANWLLFKQNDDPRAAVEGVGAGWSVKCLNDHRGEWEWKTFHKAGSSEDAGDTKSAASGESLPVSSAVSHSTSGKSEAYHPNVPTSMVTIGSSSKTSPAKTTMPPSTSRHTATSSGRRTSAPNTSTSVTLSVTTGGSSIPRVKPLSQPNTFPSSAHYPVSPRSSRPASTPDPHPHPTPAPAPASALAIYQTAHRYVMPHLAALALEHIMSTITPRSSFALLLATSLWEELRSIIEDYVVSRWDEVSASVEFEQCCKEVAAGEWGSDGGKTLTSVFRRLRSPAA